METGDKWPELWAMLYDHGASERKKEGTERYWRTLSKNQQEAVFNSISRKLANGGWIQYDPIRAIKENTPKARKLEMSYANYYAKYGTTEERDGWKMANPTGQKVIYVKEAGCHPAQ